MPDLDMNALMAMQRGPMPPAPQGVPDPAAMQGQAGPPQGGIPPMVMKIIEMAKAGLISPQQIAQLPPELQQLVAQVMGQGAQQQAPPPAMAPGAAPGNPMMAGLMGR